MSETFPSHPPPIHNRLPWRHDKQALEIVFTHTVRVWKRYVPPQSKRRQVRSKIYALYKQSTQGNADTPPSPSNHKDNHSNGHSFHSDGSNQEEKWKEWDRLRGTPSDIAKRRYITYVCSVMGEDYDHIVEALQDTPPISFCRETTSNRPICPWCNSNVGCQRPLRHSKTMLRLEQELNESPNLIQNHNEFRAWYQRLDSDAMVGCVHGVHVPISLIDSKRYNEWYDRLDIGGFCPFDPTTKMWHLLDQVMQQQLELLYSLHLQYQDQVQQLQQYENNNHDNNNHPNPTMINLHKTHSSYCDQIDVVEGLQKVYKEIRHKPFTLEIPCQRKTSNQCYARRIAAGGKNHSHPVSRFERPELNYTVYHPAIHLLAQAKQWNVSLITGTCPGPQSTQERCQVLQSRIQDQQKRHHRAQIATARLLRRDSIHKQEMQDIQIYAHQQMLQQLDDAIQRGQCQKMWSLIERGAPLNYETNHGMTCLIRCVILGGEGESQRQQRHVNAHVVLRQMIMIHQQDHDNDDNKNKNNNSLEYMTKAHGMNALMWACKINDLGMVHILIEEGAKSDSFGCANNDNDFGMNAILVAVYHGRRQALEIMLEREQHLYHNNRQQRVSQILNAFSNKLGLTPLMMCAKHRNRPMARLLIQLGANVHSTNNDGQTAADIARMFGWNAFASWFDHKKQQINGSGSIAVGNVSIVTTSSYLDDFEEKEERITKGNLEKAMKEQNLHKILEYISTGVISPNHELPDGNTPLIIAAAARDSSIIEALLKQGCDTRYSNRLGVTALMTAVQHSISNDALDSIRVILQKNSHCFDLRDIHGRSALTIASSTTGNEEVISYLLHRRKGYHTDDVSCFAFNSSSLFHHSNKEKKDSGPVKYQHENENNNETNLVEYESWKWRLPSMSKNETEVKSENTCRITNTIGDKKIR